MLEEEKWGEMPKNPRKNLIHIKTNKGKIVKEQSGKMRERAEKTKESPTEKKML
jgi:molecular chaperone DnaK (HSP70)